MDPSFLKWFCHSNALSGDDMSKKRNLLQPESTLAEFGMELMVPKSLQNNTEMSRMLFFILGIDQDVVNEDNDKLVQLRHEYRVHQIHKMCMRIGESKQHNQVLIQSVPDREGSPTNIFWTDLDFMITRMEIDLGKDSYTGKLTKENVDAGQRILVLDGDGIQEPVVNV
jgi:hypothetical protein